MHVPESSNASVVTASPATAARGSRLWAMARTILAVLFGIAGILVVIVASFTGHAIDSMAASMPGVPRWLLASIASLAVSIAWLSMLADVCRGLEPSQGSNDRPGNESHP